MMHLVVLSCLILFAPSAFAQGSGNEFTVKGHVFRDANQNGIQEGYDSGISGVRIDFPDGSSILTNREGYFEKVFPATQTSLRISIDPDTVPPGAVFTSPSEQFVNLKSGRLRKLSFGLSYVEKEYVLDKGIERDSDPGFDFELEKSTEVEIREKSGTLEINQVRWVELPKTSTKEKNENKIKTESREFEIDFNESPIELEEDSLDDVISFTKKNQIKSITIISGYDPSDSLGKKKSEVLENEIRSKLIESGISRRAIESKTEKSKLYSKIEIKTESDLESEDCFLNIDETREKIRNGFRKNISHSWKKSTKISLKCGVFERFYIIPTLRIEEIEKTDSGLEVELDSDFDEMTALERNQDADRLMISNEDAQKKSRLNLTFKSEGIPFRTKLYINKSTSIFSKGDRKTLLKVVASEHLEESRDLNVHLNFKGNFKKLKIDGEPLKASGGKYPYLHRGSRGKNKIKIFAEDGKEKQDLYFKFKLYSEPLLQLRFNWFNRWKSSDSTLFNSNYTLSGVQGARIRATSFPIDNWGLDLNMTFDINPTQITHFDNSTGQASHSSFEIVGGSRLALKNKEFNSPRLDLMAGIFRKGFDAGATAQILHPKTTLGPIIKTRVLFPEFPSQVIDLETEFAFGTSTGFQGFTFRMQQEILIHLNTLGNVFIENPTYIYYERYSIFQNLKLSIGINYEIIKFETANADSGLTSDKFLGLSLGLVYNF